ncbi:Uncharacterised protein [Vibrio cholerae]|nr:Uncharacterised protein [Vibrio cholerae]
MVKLALLHVREFNCLAFALALVLNTQLFTCAVTYGISGHPHHTFDVVDLRVHWVFEHHNITTLRFTRFH